MLHLDTKLIAREESGKTIRAAIIGAGQMGRGLVSQMCVMRGITPAIVAARSIATAKKAYQNAGIPDDKIVAAHSADEAAFHIESGRFVVTDDFTIAVSTGHIDAVVDATGIPDVGAQVAVKTIENGKHIVMLNVETDVVVGPYLKQLADDAGVIYTGSAGDEPGAVMELYSFVRAMGMEVCVVGKGKNNGLDRTANPTTMQDEAQARKMNPYMLTAFRDGTKTMVELCAMSNATGFVPDIPGAHGIESNVRGLNTHYQLEKHGGILKKHGVVEFVQGIAPAVFVTATTNNPEVAYQLEYLKMGPGPLWTFCRPYHLCSLETPLTVAKCVIDGEPTIQPRKHLVAECVAVAKRTINPGETLDGIGGYTTYGLAIEKSQADAAGYIPYGLITPGSKAKQTIQQGEIITYNNVSIDTETHIYKLRRKQDEMGG